MWLDGNWPVVAGLDFCQQLLLKFWKQAQVKGELVIGPAIIDKRFKVELCFRKCGKVI
ncbi:MAG: hypothetical protein K9L59_00710 [Desulfobacterales bacterium]|nr:hypothetical protein [Desulfobacterales bacterium]